MYLLNGKIRIGQSNGIDVDVIPFAVYQVKSYGDNVYVEFKQDSPDYIRYGSEICMDKEFHINGDDSLDTDFSDLDDFEEVKRISYELEWKCVPMTAVEQAQSIRCKVADALDQQNSDWTNQNAQENQKTQTGRSVLRRFMPGFRR